MTWTLTLARDAEKELKRLGSKEQKQVAAALIEMRRDPFSGDLKYLKNFSPAFRRRVGACRILFDVFPEQKHVQVQIIARRSEKTYRRR